MPATCNGFTSERNVEALRSGFDLWALILDAPYGGESVGAREELGARHVGARVEVEAAWGCRQPVGLLSVGRRVVLDSYRQRSIFAVTEAWAAIADRVSIDRIVDHESGLGVVKGDRPKCVDRRQVIGFEVKQSVFS